MVESSQIRPIFEIARDIKRDWHNVSRDAQPYLNAMTHINRITDMYIHEDARSIVLYFLSNASSFRGERARKLKLELKELLSNGNGKGTA